MRKKNLLMTALMFMVLLPALASARQVTFSSESENTGDSVIVSINVDDVSGIAGYNVDFTYDSKDLTAVEASLGSDFAGYFFLSNLKTPGTVRLTMMGLQGNPNSAGGRLATVKFSVLNQTLKNSPLAFTRVVLKNGSGENLADTESADGAVNGDL